MTLQHLFLLLVKMQFFHLYMFFVFSLRFKFFTKRSIYSQLLLHLIDNGSELTAGLRTAMLPIICPDTQEFKMLSPISIAEIAVQLKIIEKRIPEELKMHLQKLSELEADQFLHSNWWKHEPRDRDPTHYRVSDNCCWTILFQIIRIRRVISGCITLRSSTPPLHGCQNDSKSSGTRHQGTEILFVRVPCDMLSHN